MTTDEIRSVGIVIWLLSPVIFLLLFVLRQRKGAGWWRSWRGLYAALTTIDWIAFAVLLVWAQTPYGMIFRTSIFTLILLVMACTLMMLCAKYWRLLLANVALVSLWVFVAYGQAHWMVANGPGNVTINGQPASAEIYFGYPTDSEDEAVALAEIPTAGEYFLSFDSGDVSRATKHEIIPLPIGVWTVPSLRHLKWIAALPPQKEDQFRFVASDGRVIEVQF